MPDLRVYIAMSLDGFIATPDGGVAWLERFNSDAFDFSGFMKQIGAVVMGRRTFDQVLGWGIWPYSNLHTIVQTRRALPSNCRRTVRRGWRPTPGMSPRWQNACARRHKATSG